MRFVPLDQSVAGPGGAMLSTAVLFGMALSRAFVRDTYLGRPTPGEEYLEKEAAVEALADHLSDRLTGLGFGALSQSERCNMERGQLERGYIVPEIQTGPSLVPQKTLARMAGLGFVGRNNLLVTREYGCALTLCSVLTDAPLHTDTPSPAPQSGCGSCRSCVDACASGALLGGSWSEVGGRGALLDISRCCCPLRCMVSCPWTLRYAGLAPS